MTRAMERTPTAAKLREEELRNLILIVLNANYEGAARGEVFNGQVALQPPPTTPKTIAAT